MKNRITFIKFPVGVWETEPFATARRELGTDAIGTYLLVMERIRLAGGTESRENLMTIYDGERNPIRRFVCRRRLRRMLSPGMGLFVVTSHGMVSIVNHLSAAIARNRIQ